MMCGENVVDEASTHQAAWTLHAKNIAFVLDGTGFCLGPELRCIV
jgi:hypothetical protein